MIRIKFNYKIFGGEKSACIMEENMDYEVVKAYRNNACLRTGFNELANSVFGFDFEEWYSNGFWSDKYIPYSIFKDRKIVANVSVNLIDMRKENHVEHYIQLGTVMTDEAYRNKGFIRILMNEIEKDFSAKTDGMFLFANEGVVDFYPKFGFIKTYESQYVKTVNPQGERTAERFPMESKTDWDKFCGIIRRSVPNSSFGIVGNNELIMFYLSSFMKDCVYYINDCDAYAVAELEGDELLIYDVFSEKTVDINKVINAFGEDIRKVKLGFTPLNTVGFEKTVLAEADTVLFVKGKKLENFSDENLMFPLLSHA